MYRILRHKHGKDIWFTIQEKGWFFWNTLTYREGLPFGCIGACEDDYRVSTYDHKFSTIKEAREFICERNVEPVPEIISVIDV